MVWTWLTRIGSILGVVAFGLSIYQWTVAQQQLRIAAAIEISKAYLQDKELRTLQAQIVDSDQAIEPRYDESNLKIRAFVDLNNYIAHLANEGLIENDYLASRIICDIAWLDEVVKKRRKDFIDATRQIRKYVSNKRHRGCPEIPPIDTH